ncbi:MAG: glycosyltransferase family 2 protein [Verrucomicrobiota bacterium]
MNDRALALIPAFNEAGQIADVIQRAQPHVREVVVVDDGSTDATSAVATAAGATVIRHDVNRGKGAAIITGLKYLRQSPASCGVFLDADGQHDPDTLPAFIALAAQTGAGIVIGSRMSDTRGMPALRLRTNQFMSWVTGKLARQVIPDSQCGYRLLARTVLPDLHLATARFETETEMLIQAGRAGHKIVSLPIRTIYLPDRVSRIRPVQDGIRFFKLVGKYWPTRSA